MKTIRLAVAAALIAAATAACTRSITAPDATVSTRPPAGDTGTFGGGAGQP